MLTFPNAKINIGLNITEKRTDGFHNIESVFYPVGWSDALEVIPNDSDNVEFQTSGLEIPGNQDSNLVLKAYRLLSDAYAISGVTFHLHKVIPMGAGLGGGSADGAFALKLLNDIFKLELSTAQLQDFARKLGSDCAFFIENRPVYCYAKGDQFEDFSLSLNGKFIVLVNPDIHISTAEAYGGVTPQLPKVSLKEALSQPISTWKEIVKNDFEEKLLIKYPAISAVKTALYENGALYASMTGSGSTVYGIFDQEVDLKHLFPTYAIWQGKLV